MRTKNGLELLRGLRTIRTWLADSNGRRYRLSLDIVGEIEDHSVKADQIISMMASVIASEEKVDQKILTSEVISLSGAMLTGN